MPFTNLIDIYVYVLMHLTFIAYLLWVFHSSGACFWKKRGKERRREGVRERREGENRYADMFCTSTILIYIFYKKNIYSIFAGHEVFD